MYEFYSLPPKIFGKLLQVVAAVFVKQAAKRKRNSNVLKFAKNFLLLLFVMNALINKKIIFEKTSNILSFTTFKLVSEDQFNFLKTL